MTLKKAEAPYPKSEEREKNEKGVASVKSREVDVCVKRKWSGLPWWRRG